MKTQEELNALKEEYEAMSKKLAELTDEELAQVTGGVVPMCELEEPARAYTDGLEAAADPRAAVSEASPQVGSYAEKIRILKANIAMRQRTQYTNSPYLDHILNMLSDN